MKQLVIIPGGFHPFHKGHKSLYDAAKKVFPRADIYIAATTDTSTRPFPFDLKKKLAHLGGVPKEKFIEVKSPFQPREITQHYDPDDTVLIYVRSEKDRNTSPHPDKIKKNGEPSYLQSIHGLKKGEMQPLSKHGYMAYLPTTTFGSEMSSSTEIRNNWPKYNEKQKSQLIQHLYPITKRNGQLESNIVKIFDQVLGSQQINEKWSKKYKDSIDCSNPKGFSQKAHCQGKKKKQNEDVSDDYINEKTDNETLNEIFDKPKNIEKTWDREDEVRFDGFISGEQIAILMKEIKENLWKIEFRVGGRYDARGDMGGSEIGIFATVISAIRQFVNERKPETIVFEARKSEFGQETNRVNLYKRMVKKFAVSNGYIHQEIEQPDSTVFTLRRIDSIDSPES